MLPFSWQQQTRGRVRSSAAPALGKCHQLTDSCIPIRERESQFLPHLGRVSRESSQVIRVDGSESLIEMKGFSLFGSCFGGYPGQYKELPEAA